MPTINDIAKLAHVSATTVSRVLNRDPSLSVSDETFARVLHAAEELNYTKSKRRKTSTGRKSTVNLAAIRFIADEDDEFQNPYFASIREGIEQACLKSGIELRLCTPGDSQLMQADGVIVVGDSVEFRDRLMPKINNVVFVDSSPNPDKYDSVLIDYHGATVKVLDYLLELGHRSIGYIGGTGYYDEHHSHKQDPRHAAVQQYLSKKGLFDERHIHIASWSAEGGYSCAKRAVTEGEMPSAYFVGSDRMALGVMKALEESGHRVPEDVSIVGFDDIELATYAKPALTTIRTFPNVMGEMGVKLLLDRLEGRTVPVQLTIPGPLIERNSSCQFSRQIG